MPDALAVLVARFARTHGPFTTEELRGRYGVDASAVLRELERSGDLVRGELRPGGSEREWCDVEVLRRLRRASLAALRKEIEPTDRRSLAAFLPSWQGVDRHSAAGAGVDRLREVLVGAAGLALPVEIWERDVLPRRTGAYSQSWLDSLCASGELVWVGAGPRGARSGRVALYFREDAPSIGPPSLGALRARRRIAARRAPSTSSCARGWRRARASSPTCSPSWTPRRRRCARRCGTSCGRARSPTTPGRRCARPISPCPRRSLARGAARLGSYAALAAPPLRRAPPGRSPVGAGPAGAGPLVADRARVPRRRSADPAERRRALCELLLERYGIVTREQVLAEGIKGGFATLYQAFSRPGDARCVPPRLLHRGHGRRAVRAARRRRAPARRRSSLAACAPAPAPASRRARSCSPRPTRPSPTAPRCRGPSARSPRRRPARVAGAYVVMVDDRAGAVRGARRPRSRDPHATRLVHAQALRALAEAVRAGRVRQARARADRRRAGDRL